MCNGEFDLTNAEVIRGYDNEELSEFIFDVIAYTVTLCRECTEEMREKYCGMFPFYTYGDNGKTKIERADILKWLIEKRK